jgi:hypothetical protein
MGPIQPPEAFNATKIELQVLNRMLFTIDVEACINFTFNGISGVRTSSEMEGASMPSKVQKTFFSTRLSDKNKDFGLLRKIELKKYLSMLILET